MLARLDTTQKITIDREYLGHEDLIEQKIKIYTAALGIKRTIYLQFGHVGKLSRAHQLAYRVARGKITANYVAHANEIIQMITGTKKIGTT